MPSAAGRSFFWPLRGSHRRRLLNPFFVRNVFHVATARFQIPPVRARRPEGSHLAGRRADQGTDLAEHRSARRQSGADRADERRAQAGDVPAAGEHRLQGDRGGLPVGLADRVQLRAPADRGEPDPGRRDHPGADTGARVADPSHDRVVARGPKGHGARLQRLCTRHAQGGAGDGRGRHRRDGGGPDEAGQAAGGRASRDRVGLRVFARDVLGHRAGLLQAGGGCRGGCLGSHAAEQVHHQPANDSGALHAEHLCRHDRVDASQPGQARLDHPVGAPAQRPGHGHCGGRAGADGRGRAAGRLPLRQRRAHRQLRPGQHRAEPVHAGGFAGAGLLRHRRDPSGGGALQPDRGAPASPICGRPGLHVLLGLAPGRHQEGVCRPQGGRHLGNALSAHRSEGPGPLV